MPFLTRRAPLVLAAVALAVALGACSRDAPRADAPDLPDSLPEAGVATGTLYGRVTTHDGDVYEGPLRWGRGEEAFWEHAFNGVKAENPWAASVPAEALPGRREPTTVFGVEVPWGRPDVDLERPFMARFGDVARVEARGEGLRDVVGEGYDPTVRVTLKSGTAVDLDRLSSSDFDDGVRVWDARRGRVDLGAREVRSVEFLPGDSGDLPDRLYGTVRTDAGDFTGALQWDRELSLGRDRLTGQTADGALSLPFDAIRTVARGADGGVRVTTRDGGEAALSGTRATGRGHRGVTVDDPRVGRVLVPWAAFRSLELGRAGPSLAYADFPAGRPLSGSVTTRDGRRLAGRLVYDLDESETTETLDAPADGVDYSIPFGRIASIALADGGRATVTLRDGTALALDRSGDLGAGNGGLLVFADGEDRPAYVAWAEVERVDLDAPPEGGAERP